MDTPTTSNIECLTIKVRINGGFVFKANLRDALAFDNWNQYCRQVAVWSKDEDFQKAYEPYRKSNKVPLQVFGQMVRLIYGSDAKVQLIGSDGQPFGQPFSSVVKN